MIRMGSQLLQLLTFKLVILYHEKSLLKLYQAAFTSYKDPYKFALQLSIGRLHQAGQTITPGEYRSWVQGPDNETHGSVQFTMSVEISVNKFPFVSDHSKNRLQYSPIVK